MYIPSEKVDFSGPLILAVPSEGCLGQRVVDQLINSEKSFKFVGSFDHTSLQPMVGFTDDGRLVTCMELYYSEVYTCGVIQIRAPPTNIKNFVSDFASWFAQSGFERILAVSGAQSSFPLHPVMACGPRAAQYENATEATFDFVKQSVRRAGFSKVLVRDANSDVLFSTDIFNLEPLVQAVCDIAKIKYRDIMSIENLQISDPPVGIF